jgi:hypothetical protein
MAEVIRENPDKDVRETQSHGALFVTRWPPPDGAEVIK